VSRVHLGLGSNLGDRRAHLDAAVERLRALGEMLAVSPMIETPALLAPGDATPQPAYLNAAAALETKLEPQALLEALRAIERAEGRPAERAKWQARTLDLDILLWGDQVIDTVALVVPHPQMHLRRFVLEPLAAIAPEAVHPVLHLSVRELLVRVA
jgi:2-amino-4-hydroxy-6-hydroxymethyldihydropteridine diphosphokinase